MNNDMSEPVICIPRVFINIDESRIKNVFGKLFGINNIKQINVIKKLDKRDKPYNKVFIHFYSWPIEHIEIRNKLLEGKEIKIVYEQPWFWKCSASREKNIQKPQNIHKPQNILNEDGNKRTSLSSFNILPNSKMINLPYCGRAAENDVKIINWSNNKLSQVK